MPDLFYLTRFAHRVRLFQGLGTPELSAVARAAQYMESEDGYSFCRQDALADSVYALHQGRVKLTRSTADGSRVLLRVLGPGDVFGATGATRDETYPFTASAVGWCQILAWKAEAMAELMERYPRIALNAISNLDATLQELRTRCCELATQRIEQRLARVLLRLAHQVGYEAAGRLLLGIPLSRRELAEMTGTTLYSASRILSAWRRAGVIDAGRQWVAILHPDHLRAIAAKSTLCAPRRATAHENGAFALAQRR